MRCKVDGMPLAGQGTRAGRRKAQEERAREGRVRVGAAGAGGWRSQCV
jgi:hypothetical protein